MDFCARCGQQTQPGQPACPRCGLALGGRSRGVRPRWMVAAGIVVVAVAAGAIVATFLVRSPVRPTAASSLTSASAVQVATGQAATSPAGAGQTGAGQPGAGQSSAGAVSEQAAAQDLSQLLTQSISSRNAIVSAYNDVDTCGSGLAADAQTFQQAATSRESLLARLGTLPGAGTLPPRLLQALNGAWQASVQADQDYAAWARDEKAQSCRANDTANYHYQATTAPNRQATVDKTAFTGLWNPVAVKYGLPTYQQDEL